MQRIVYSIQTDSYLTAYQVEPDIRFAWSKNKDKALLVSNADIESFREYMNTEIKYIELYPIEIDMRGVSFG